MRFGSNIDKHTLECLTDESEGGFLVPDGRFINE